MMRDLSGVTGVLLILTFVLPGCSGEGRGPPPVANAVLAPGTAEGEAFQRGREAYDSASFVRARLLFDSASVRAREADDMRARAQALLWSCLSSWRLVELETGRHSCAAALELETRSGLTDLTAQTRNALGLIAWDASRLVEAIDNFERSLQDAESAGDLRGVARATGNMGLIYTEFGDFDRARESFENMRESGRALDEPVFEANALTNLGMLAVRTGAAHAAIGILGEARRVYQSNGEVFRETNAIGQLATAWAALGDYSRARATIDTAIARAEELGLLQEIASNVEVLASIASSTGDVRGSLQLYERARSFNESAGLRLEEAGDLRAESELYLAIGDMELARSSVRRSLEIDRAAGAAFATMRDLIVFAEIESRSGNADAAAARLVEARHAAGPLDAPLPRGEIAVAEARILERRSDAPGAIRVLDGARRDLDGVGVNLAWQADLIRSRAFARLNRLDSAARYGNRAVRTLEIVRRRIGSPVLRTAFLAEQSDAYFHLADVLARAGRVTESFEVADGAHGRAILDHLADARVAGLDAPVDRFGLVDRMDQLRATIGWLHSMPPGEQDAATLGMLYDSLAAASRAYDALVPAAVPATRSENTLLGGLPTRFDDVQAALDSDEVLLEYLVGISHTWIYVVRPGSVQAVYSPLDLETAGNRARVARDLMQQPDEPGPSAVIERLWADLIGPVEQTGALHAARRMIIVRHGPFASFPFAALRRSSSEPWLLERFELQVIPTAAALVVLRDLQPVVATAAAVSTVFAPSTMGLPASLAEAKAIARIRSDMRTRIGPAATESAVRDVLVRGAPILHVAAHAVFDRFNPLFSHLVLSSGGSGPDDDGRLEIRELIELRGGGTLVFLSGCETAVGNAFATSFSNADDYATIAQAFLYAGARNVIATLWRVTDTGAEAFATRFYHHLQNEPITRALALTQREMIADPRYSAPFYWAGYQLAGNGGQIEPAAARRAGVAR